MTKEERELRVQFRENRVKRKAVNEMLSDAREQKRFLVEERNKINAKASAMGIQLGKKPALASS